MLWLWILLIILLVFGAIATCLAVLYCWLIKKKNGKKETQKVKRQDNVQSESEMKLKLPLPPALEVEDMSMEDTQQTTNLGPMKAFDTLLSIKESEDLSPDNASALDSSCAQHSTDDEHVLNPESRWEREERRSKESLREEKRRSAENIPLSSSAYETTTTTAPISAGATPRIARKLPQSKSKRVDPEPTKTTSTTMLVDTPIKGVETAQELTVVRSEHQLSICDEDAGRTPVKRTSPIDGDSLLTTYTPSGSTDAGTTGRAP